VRKTPNGAIKKGRGGASKSYGLVPRQGRVALARRWKGSSGDYAANVKRGRGETENSLFLKKNRKDEKNFLGTVVNPNSPVGGDTQPHTGSAGQKEEEKIGGSLYHWERYDPGRRVRTQQKF